MVRGRRRFAVRSFNRAGRSNKPRRVFRCGFFLCCVFSWKGFAMRSFLFGLIVGALVWVVALVCGSLSFGQCVGGVCRSSWLEPIAPVVVSEPVGVSSVLVRESAVRIRVGNSCGSGSICGRNEKGVFVLTNAHVVGTTLGRSVRVDRGGSEIEGRVIASAFSDVNSVDFAFVLLPVGSFADCPAIALSVGDVGRGERFSSVGFPKCAGPVSFSGVVSDDGSVVKWLPNAIPGQSGSALVFDGVQKVLLTWRWGGYGAGQATGRIYSMLQSGKIPQCLRPAGLEESVMERQPTENGIFLEAGVLDFPVWDTSGGGGGDDPSPGDEFSGREKGLLLALRRRSSAAGVDWLEVIDLVLRLIALFTDR